MPESVPMPLKTLLWRGWRKKCPQCGEGPLYKKWLAFREQCPNCGLKYVRDQGDILGPMVFIDRIFFLIPMVTVFCFCMPDAPPSLYIPSGAVMIILFVRTMPNRNGVCLAFDYYLRNHDNA